MRHGEPCCEGLAAASKRWFPPSTVKAGSGLPERSGLSASATDNAVRLFLPSRLDGAPRQGFLCNFANNSGAAMSSGRAAGKPRVGHQADHDAALTARRRDAPGRVKHHCGATEMSTEGRSSAQTASASWMSLARNLSNGLLSPTSALPIAGKACCFRI